MNVVRSTGKDGERTANWYKGLVNRSVSLGSSSYADVAQQSCTILGHQSSNTIDQGVYSYRQKHVSDKTGLSQCNVVENHGHKSGCKFTQS